MNCGSLSKPQSQLSDNSNPDVNIPVDMIGFESHLQQVIDKVKSASVLVTTYELLAGVRGMSASGVCVTSEGIIMTPGHMTIPGGEYKITFPDGTEASALGMGKIGALK